MSTLETAFAAGTVIGLLYGMALIESIIIGKVVQSEFLVTTQDAPNSPMDIARINIDEISSDPLSIGILIKKNLFVFDIPKVRAQSSKVGSKDLNAGRIILTTNGVVIITCAMTGVSQKE